MISTRTAMLIGMASLGAATIATAEQRTEQPDYTVVDSADGVELREYAPRIVAEVTVDAPSRDAASSIGFRPLAGYIFGGNDGSSAIAMTAPVTTQALDTNAGTKIAMTAPVTTEAADDDRYTVRFSMPRDWTMQTLPTPNDPAVTLREIPAEARLAYRFTGAKSQDTIDSADAAIIAYATRNALTLSATPVIAGYDGPRVPTERRRWEVMRLVESDYSTLR